MPLKPRLFLSYARVDIDLADKLAAHLQVQGCTLWMDRHQLLTGDDFVIGLQRELSRCDGLILLLTHAAAKSSWCQAEVQRALALALPVLVIGRDPDAALPEALERLLRDVQRSEWFDTEEPAVGLQVRRARRRRLVRRLHLSGAAGLRFTSHSESSDFITSEVGIIEDSWIVQRRAPPGPHVIDLGKPSREILFDGIQFERVRFEGQFKPEWIQNSVFRDCSFPPGLAEALMSEPGNTVESSGAFVETHRS